MAGACELCGSRHASHQAHSFATVNTAVNKTANTVNAAVNTCAGCRERDEAIAERDALIAELRAETKPSGKPGTTRKDYMREYMQRRRKP